MNCRKAFEKHMTKDGRVLCRSTMARLGKYLEIDVKEKWELWQKAWKAGRADLRKKK